MVPRGGGVLRAAADGAEPDYAVCPEAGYYNFSKEKAGASGWRRLGSTDWYYEGQFTSEMPDLALDNPLVREEIQKIAAFWLGLGADGFRLDAVKDYFTGNVEEDAAKANFETAIKEKYPELTDVVWPA